MERLYLRQSFRGVTGVKEPTKEAEALRGQCQGSSCPPPGRRGGTVMLAEKSRWGRDARAGGGWRKWSLPLPRLSSPAHASYWLLLRAELCLPKFLC